MHSILRGGPMRLFAFTISSMLLFLPTVADATTQEVLDATIYTQVAAWSSVADVQQYVETFGPGIIGAETRDDEAFGIASSQFEPNAPPPFSLIKLTTSARGYIIEHGGDDQYVFTYSSAYSTVTSYLEIFDHSSDNISSTDINLQAEINALFSAYELTDSRARWSFLIYPLDGIGDPVINDAGDETSSFDVKYDNTLVLSTNTLYQVTETLFFESDSGIGSGLSEIDGFFDPTFVLVTPDLNLELVQSRALVATPVPELSSWAMMLLGFAGLGFASYQSRQPRIAAR